MQKQISSWQNSIWFNLLGDFLVAGSLLFCVCRLVGTYFVRYTYTFREIYTHFSKAFTFSRRFMLSILIIVFIKSSFRRLCILIPNEENTKKNGRKDGALCSPKRERGSWGLGNFISNTYALHCHHQNDCIKVGSCVSHFNVSLTVWAETQDSVHKPQF